MGNVFLHRDTALEAEELILDPPTAACYYKRLLLPRRSSMAGQENQSSGDHHSGAFSEEKIYCANCLHCKVRPESTGEGEDYLLRVRCDAGKWTKKHGTEKVYKYFTVARRSPEACDAYEPMGDTRSFIRDLRLSLPTRDEKYSLQN